MVDLDILKNRGCDTDSLKSKLKLDVSTALTHTDLKNGSKTDRLRHLIHSRIDEGRNGNVSNYRIYQALDAAWDSPLNQISATMVRSLIDSNMSTDGMMDALATWGVNLSDVLEEVPDPKSPGKTMKRVNMPAFFRVTVPLVRPYVTIRRAKMMNDRKLVPFIKYEPAISTERTRMRCEVITSRVEEISNQYGLWDVEDQTCWRMLHYGVCLRFPVEEWHKEEQLVADDEDSPFDGGEKDGDYKRVVMKEGIRYHMPHPTRMFWDNAWPTHTLNTNSGCSYAGYWRVMRYGEIRNKKNFFNLDAIAIGNSAEWFGNNRAFFDNVYPCTMKFPTLETAGAGAGKFDEEKKISDAFYTTADDDKGILITELFMKIIPSDYDLGDYDHPVWFRFVVGNLDTILYAAPLPYTTPVLFDGYDPVSGRTMYPSMSLEVLPYQDQFGNLLSQHLLSIKNNLTNMILVDTACVNEEDIGFLQKWSQKLWSALNFVRFDSRKMFKAQQTPQVTFPQKFPQMDTQSAPMAMKILIEILERILGMSSQELGQSASHEQTREEIRNIALSTSTRAEFTGSTLDRSKQAWKRQLYEGLMAYGSDDGYAQIPADPKLKPEDLSKLGFTHDGGDKQTKKIKVKFEKTAIKYETFAANRDGDDRINDTENARSQGAFMQQLLGNPITATAIGPDQAIAMANLIAKAVGFPRDFKLHNRGPDTTPEENNAQILQQVQQFIQEATQGMMEEVKGALGPIQEENNQQSQALEEVVQHLQQLDQLLGGAAPQPPQDMPPQEMPPEQLPPEGPAMMPPPMAQ